jgi:hypothetical protein
MVSGKTGKKPYQKKKEKRKETKVGYGSSDNT